MPKTSQRQGNSLEYLLKMAFAEAGEAIFMSDQAGKILYFNPAFQDLMNIDPDQILKSSCQEIVCGGLSGDAFQCPRHEKEVITPGMKVKLQAENGKWYEISFTLLPEGVIYHTIRDVTEREVVKGRLHRSEEKYRDFFTTLRFPFTSPT